MKKYIVPVKQRVLEWKSFFETCFADEEQLETAMSLLATMMTSLIMDLQFNKQDFNPFISLFERCEGMVDEMCNTGQLSLENVEDVTQLAYEITSGLVAYLKDVSVLKLPSVIKFEGFVGMDICISITEQSDKETGDEECLTG